MELQTQTSSATEPVNLEKEGLLKVVYDNKIVRNFIYATIAWGIISLLVGVLIASQLVWPELNAKLPWLTFGRLRPLHTNGAIFAFVGNIIFAGVYHSSQRVLKTRMYSDVLSKIHFWGWQLIIISAVITLPLGFSTSKEYAELEWPIDIAIALIWVVFAINFFGTMIKRNVKHLYVALWFYIATIVTVALLHIVNSIELPVGFLKSYSAYAGVQDALVQWWYGHNAVAFFLTTPFLGLMYYYLPKAAGRPVYSYRLSIIHFWTLIFIYIWAGPHHLLYSSLPDWAQSIGVVFSIMLIAPSWGGMINGLLTVRGAWDKVRKEPILKFLIVGVTAYGMATFEGPLHSLKFVNALSHFTDWIPAHVHIGTLGWNGFLTFAIIYYVVPRIFNTKLYSQKWANLHFWMGTIGMIFWAVSMYVSGVMQGLMLQEFTEDATLRYANFLETTMQIIPMYFLRALGGLIYLSGMVLMFWNVYKTIKTGKLIANEEEFIVPYTKAPAHKEGKLTGYLRHRVIERKPMMMVVVSLIVVAVGGFIEYIPLATIKSNVPQIASVMPYTPLELEGRDLYIREGCNNCHSQMVRPFRSETERYGEYSKAGEFVYDHPFLWGSRRTGPDLHRIGKKYPHSWHIRHMENPQLTSPGSIMPAYPWLLENKLDVSNTSAKIKAMRRLGVPYAAEYEYEAKKDLEAQALVISKQLKEDNIKIAPNKEIVALVAYLQRLGTDIQSNK